MRSQIRTVYQNFLLLLACVIALPLLLGAAPSPAESNGPCARHARAESPAGDVTAGQNVGELAPDFTLPDLQGNPVGLATFRGCIVVLEFWASWCPPCWASAAHLEELRSTFEQDGFVVVGVSLDRSASDIQRFLSSVGEPAFAILWGSFFQAHEIARQYGVRAVPRVFLIDRQGIIRFTGHPQELDETMIRDWL